MNKSEFVASTNSYITDYIKFADVKAGALLTLSSLLAAGIGRLSFGLFDSLEGRDSCWCWAITVVTIWVGVSLLGTLWMSLRALSPNLQKAKDSLRSFPDIAGCKCEDYTQSSLKLNSEEEIVSHFCAHNWTLSRIADAKFKALQCAVSWLRSAIIAAFTFALLYGFLSLTANAKGETKCAHDVKTSPRITDRA